MARAHRSITKDPAKAFISTWDTAITYTGSTADNQIRLPLISTGTYKFTVQWGDNTSNVITSWNQAEVTHTYPAPGVYTVTITGFIKGWDFAGQDQVSPAGVVGDRRKIISITQWGCLRLVTYENLTLLAGAFYECSNLDLSGVTDMFNFKGTTSAIGFIRRCTVPTVPNINKWDVSKLTWFRNMLRDNPFFNGDISYWNVSRGKNFGNFVNGYTNVAPYGAFNQDITNWDMSNAEDISYMFFSQPYFNQEIGKWNITNKVTTAAGIVGQFNLPGIFTNAGTDSINNWDVSNVTNFQSIFQLQPLFNCYIGDWNTGNVTNMFYAIGTNPPIPAGIFNQDISNWDMSKVTDMRSMLAGQPLFNQEIGKWNLGNVITASFALSSDSPGAFTNLGSSSINNWNLTKATTLRGIFERCTSFNQPINNWSLPLVTDMRGFLYEIPSETYAFSKQNYSDFLINLASQPLQPNVQLQIWQFYGPSAVAARAVLTSAPNNWTIVDLGLEP